MQLGIANYKMLTLADFCLARTFSITLARTNSTKNHKTKFLNNNNNSSFDAQCVTLYGCEIWTVGKEEKQQIEGFKI